jgi:hypothetical protein
MAGVREARGDTMMMHHRPIAARRAPPTGFGFDEIMARPFQNLFRRWYDAASLLPPLPDAPVRRPDFRRAA